MLAEDGVEEEVGGGAGAWDSHGFAAKGFDGWDFAAGGEDDAGALGERAEGYGVFAFGGEREDGIVGGGGNMAVAGEQGFHHFRVGLEVDSADGKLVAGLGLGQVVAVAFGEGEEDGFGAGAAGRGEEAEEEAARDEALPGHAIDLTMGHIAPKL